MLLRKWQTSFTNISAIQQCWNNFSVYIRKIALRCELLQCLLDRFVIAGSMCVTEVLPSAIWTFKIVAVVQSKRDKYSICKLDFAEGTLKASHFAYEFDNLSSVVLLLPTKPTKRISVGVVLYVSVCVSIWCDWIPTWCNSLQLKACSMVCQIPSKGLYKMIQGSGFPVHDIGQNHIWVKRFPFCTTRTLLFSDRMLCLPQHPQYSWMLLLNNAGGIRHSTLPESIRSGSSSSRGKSFGRTETFI